MPELPDIELYLHALRPRVVGRVLERVRVINPFVVRSVDPPLEAVEGRKVCGVSRLGKRVVFGMEGDLHIVVHLMIAGRFRWMVKSAKPPGRIGLAAFHFPDGALMLTEAGTKKRASLHVVHGQAALATHDSGGIDPLEVTLEQFAAALRRENHTLKRSLTDPRLFAGIGNAYSDEIFHSARLSPIKLTGRLGDEEIARLFEAVRRSLREWTARLIEEYGDRFPGAGDVTAFRPDFAVHGKFGKPCPVCGTRVQRIRYAENETNYCPRCQTEGRVLADRSLSRLLREDWPRRVEEWEGGT